MKRDETSLRIGYGLMPAQTRPARHHQQPERMVGRHVPLDAREPHPRKLGTVLRINAPATPLIRTAAHFRLSGRLVSCRPHALAVD